MPPPSGASWTQKLNDFNTFCLTSSVPCQDSSWRVSTVFIFIVLAGYPEHDPSGTGIFEVGKGSMQAFTVTLKQHAMVTCFCSFSARNSMTQAVFEHTTRWFSLTPSTSMGDLVLPEPWNDPCVHRHATPTDAANAHHPLVVVFLGVAEKG